MPNQLGHPSRHVLNERSFKWITVTLYWFLKLLKSKIWSGAWNKIYSTHPIQHMSGWPNWLGARLQSNDGCCWEIKSHLRELFSKFIFSTIILSDRSSVRFAYREKPECAHINVLFISEKYYVCHTFWAQSDYALKVKAKAFFDVCHFLSDLFHFSCNLLFIFSWCELAFTVLAYLEDTLRFFKTTNF